MSSRDQLTDRLFTLPSLALWVSSLFSIMRARLYHRAATRIYDGRTLSAAQLLQKAREDCKNFVKKGTKAPKFGATVLHPLKTMGYAKTNPQNLQNHPIFRQNRLSKPSSLLQKNHKKQQCNSCYTLVTPSVTPLST